MITRMLAAAGTVTVLCGAPTPAEAIDLASSTASSASSAGSASVGSASDSLRGSSNSSAGPKQMAAGAYQILHMAEVPGRPDLWRLSLAGAEAPGAAPDQAGAREAQPTAQWELQLPRSVAEREGLAPGRVLRAAPQPYGVSFAALGQAQPFFLVLTPEWERELPARPVGADRGA